LRELSDFPESGAALGVSASAVTENLKIFQPRVFIGFRPLSTPSSTGLPNLA
jgi:hypothetical protein